MEREATQHEGLSGLAWRLGGPFITRAIQRKYELFRRLVQPGPGTRILDVGATAQADAGFNFLERWYPWPERITAVAHGRPAQIAAFHRRFPRVKFLLGDGRALPVSDGAFDLVFSNGVLEHVGRERDQRRFVAEALRVGRRCFLSTPNAGFPLDTHTMFPFVHYLPRAQRDWIYRRTGKGAFTAPGSLDLLSERRLRALFPEEAHLRLERPRTGGMVSTLVALASLEPMTEAA